MMTVEMLLDLLQREQRAAQADLQQASLMTDESLAERGDAIVGLSLVGMEGGSVVLTCNENNSRFRPGSRIELRCPTSRLRGTITELSDQGRVLLIRLEHKATMSAGPWVAREVEIDLYASLCQCLRKLQPGAPGWRFFRGIAGDTSASLGSPGSGTDRALVQAMMDRVIAESGQALDASQLAAIERCLLFPGLAAIQGPPGTGKTMVLALVAECSARLGKRTVVLAPTHQAVNNALTVTHRLFPSRRIVKIGDELRRESLADDIGCQLLRVATGDMPPRLTSEMIVGMTFVSALYHLVLRSSGLAPNVVIIDEAGQLPVVQGSCTGLIGAGSTFLFGDDAQMPPVFASEIADDPLAISLFARVKTVCPDTCAMLDTTYRLNHQLCRVIANNFYGNATSTLRPSKHAASRTFDVVVPATVRRSVQAALESKDSFVWFQTPNSHCRQSNLIEADYIAEVVATCLRNGVQSRDVAVVTPFRRQAAVIRGKIQGFLPDGCDDVPIVDTVERVQGLTVNVIAISMATSDPEFAANLASFLFSPNRLNVAISRARTKVILACSPSVFEMVPSEFRGLLGREQYRRVLQEAIVTKADE